MLLLEPGRVVPVSRLVEAVWADDPPETAAHQVRKAVADLRHRISNGARTIVTDGPGYRMDLAEGQLDLAVFGDLVRRARAAVAAGNPEEAVSALRSALALWRGPVLSGAAGMVIEAAAATLEERRLSAAEQSFELRLGLGETGAIAAELRELVAEHPLRETLRGQLMLALYRSGRPAEALEEFGRVRELLRDELGIDPGAQLAALHEGILRNSPELAAPEPPAVPTAPDVQRVAAGGRPRAEAPSTLPYDLADFTGREQELKRIGEVGTLPHEERTPVVAIDGMGGSGKTSLAVRAAHQLAECYPDGQLYIDLRGHTPGEQQLQPGATVDILLRALGLPADRIPEAREDRCALWRATVSQRRLLILLDNAADTSQILPVLPPTPGCLVLVTSRARLVDLDGADWISLGAMPPAESADLIAGTLGRQQAENEPEAAAELAELCGHLPLALRLATARLRNRPLWTVGYLVDRLRDDSRRLDELSSGERSVEATLRLSYQAMGERYRVAFRLLGLHPGADIDLWSAASLLGTGPQEAEDILERLLDFHLLQQHELGLYTFHDLVRSFAQRLRNEDPEQSRRAALERVLDYYLAATGQACDLMFPGRELTESRRIGTVFGLPPVQSQAEALHWFDREKNSVLEAVRLAAVNRFPQHAAEIARHAVFHLNLRGLHQEFTALASAGAAAAREAGDHQLTRMHLFNLAVAQWKLGEFQQGITAASEGLECARTSGDRRGEGLCLHALGMLHSATGNLARAREELRQGIAIHRDIGDRRHQAQALTHLSEVSTWLGSHDEGIRAAEEAVRLSRELKSEVSEIVSLADLAYAHLASGRDEEAVGLLDRARKMCQTSEVPENVVLVLVLSADAYDRLGRTEEADVFAEQARELVHKRGTPMRRSTVENILGLVQQRRGDRMSSLRSYQRAYEFAVSIGYRIEMAHALGGLAEVSSLLGDTQAAADHRDRAAGLFDGMGVPEHARRGLMPAH
nr:BTAD domain-containing putative transcriptional regulator [Kitasatospora sp. GP82]